MRRAWPFVVLALLALPQVGLGQAAALPTFHGTLEGFGTAPTFFVRAGGYALEGGVTEWTFLCGGCFIRVTLTESSFVTTQNGVTQVLPQGVYEVRDFRGYMSHSATGGGHLVTLAGVGQVVAL